MDVLSSRILLRPSDLDCSRRFYRDVYPDDLGLGTADPGQATVNDQRLRWPVRPLGAVGAMLDARAVYGNRSATSHPRCLAC